MARRIAAGQVGEARPTFRGRSSGPITTRLSDASHRTRSRSRGSRTPAKLPSASPGPSAVRAWITKLTEGLAPSASVPWRSATSQIRTRASARRWAGVVSSVSDGGRVNSWIVWATVSAAVPWSSPVITVRSPTIATLTPSSSSGWVPSARAHMAKWRVARRSDRWSWRVASSRSCGSQAASASSWPGTRARARRSTACVVIRPSRQAAPVAGSSSATSPCCRARCTSVRVWPVFHRIHAVVEAWPSSVPTPRRWALVVRLAATASSRSTSWRIRIKPDPISVSVIASTSSSAVRTSTAVRTARIGSSTPVRSFPALPHPECMFESIPNRRSNSKRKPNKPGQKPSIPVRSGTRRPMPVKPSRDRVT